MSSLARAERDLKVSLSHLTTAAERIAMKLYNLDKSTLMEVSSLKRDGNNIQVKGTILGSMPVTCVLTPAEARGLVKLLGPKMMLFMLSFLFRK